MRSGSLVSFKGGSLCPDVAKTSCSSSLCLTNIEVFLVILIFILVLATNEGRSKLLMALTLSTDSSLRFHYEALGEKGPAKGAGKGKDAPVGRTDNSTSTEPTYTMPSDPTTDSAKLSVETTLPSTSTAGSTAIPSSSPSGSTSTATTGPGDSTRPKLDLVDDPTPKVPLDSKTVPMSVRQLNCCRASCQYPGCQALCGYNSEIPYDSHFSQHSTTLLSAALCDTMPHCGLKLRHCQESR